MESGQSTMDALTKLELAMRPQSVPSWLSSETNHAPKVAALGPRTSSVELVDQPTQQWASGSVSAASGGGNKDGTSPHTDKTGPKAPSPSVVRPRAPIGMHKEAVNPADKEFLAKGSEHPSPKRSRHRARQQANQSKSRRVKQSLMESFRSLEFFDKTNRSRELTTKISAMRSSEDPEGDQSTSFTLIWPDCLSSANISLQLRCVPDNVHFVNIDDSLDELESVKLIAGDDDPNANVSGRFFKPDSLENRAVKYLAESTGTKAPAEPPEVFQIPELPHGQNLVVNILSTWGDPFYVGLMGIEVFDHTGHAVYLSDVDKQLSADPPDLNILDHDRLDPRTVDKLVDKHYFTCDELHAWLAPFSRGQNHFVYMDFDYPLSISMLRIWNYNTTRIHSYRGARYVEVSLDGKFVFKGEICRAPGSVVEDVNDCNECILFTMTPSILQLIEKYEKQEEPTADTSPTGMSGWQSPIGSPSASSSSTAATPTGFGPDPRLLERPKTGNKATRVVSRVSSHLGNCSLMDPGTLGSDPESNMFAPITPLPKSVKSPSLHPSSTLPAKSFRPCTAPVMGDSTTERPLSCKTIELVLEANWGDPYEIGLAGLQILDGNYVPLTICLDEVAVSAPIHETQLQKLVATHGARHLSAQPEEMWSAPLQELLALSPSRRAITLVFPGKVSIRALKVWNYNTTLEESFKGTKQMDVRIDGVHHTRFSLRKAPGNLMDFDFGQFLYLRTLHQQQQATLAPSEAFPLPTSGKQVELLS
ncbi:hypothetical protein BBJ28_00024559, partial [Nothophytophthora sp. Chile5]